MSNLKQAIPTVEENTGNVYYWELIGSFSNAQYEQDYSFVYDCKAHNNIKPLSDWTKEQIENLYPTHAFQNLFNRYVNRKNNPKNKIQADDSFDINSL